MNPRPIAAEALQAFQLLVTFQNGEKRIFDVAPLLNLPLYEPLRDRNLFKQVKADGMCVYWNQEIDLCPDRVYTDSMPINKS